MRWLKHAVLAWIVPGSDFVENLVISLTKHTHIVGVYNGALIFLTELRHTHNSDITHANYMVPCVDKSPVAILLIMKFTYTILVCGEGFQLPTSHQCGL